MKLSFADLPLGGVAYVAVCYRWRCLSVLPNGGAGGVAGCGHGWRHLGRCFWRGPRGGAGGHDCGRDSCVAGVRCDFCCCCCYSRRRSVVVTVAVAAAAAGRRRFYHCGLPALLPLRAVGAAAAASRRRSCRCRLPALLLLQAVRSRWVRNPAGL